MTVFVGFTMTPSGAMVCRKAECLQTRARRNDTIGIAIRRGVKSMFQKPVCDVCQEPLEE